MKPITPHIPIVPARHPKVHHDPDRVERTLRRMWELANIGACEPTTIQLARSIVREPVLHANSRDARQVAMMQSVWQWVRDNIAFVGDPNDGIQDAEVLSDVENILRLGAADCDEHQIITRALLQAVGFQPRQIWYWVGGPVNPDVGFHVPVHVFCVGFVSSGRDYVVDSTMTDYPFGTCPGDSGWKYWGYSPSPMRNNFRHPRRR